MPIATPRAIGARARSTVVRTWVLLLVLALWEWRTRQSPSLFVPRASDILERCWDVWFGGPASRLFLSDTFMDNVVPSLGRMFRGWLIAVVIATPIGIALGVTRWANAMATPIVRFGLATPSVMVLPLAIAIFGLGDSMNIFVIVLGCTWPMMTNTIDGVKSVDLVALRTARSLHLGRWARFRYVLLPGASPRIVAGLRVSLGVALILMVSSELFAVTQGIGRFILSAQQSFNFLDVWAGIFLVGALGLAINFLFSLGERRLLRWHIRSRELR